MKFKIGFEFQEGHNLCKKAFDQGALNGYIKKPIFEVSADNTVLWHAEFDDRDIEFVTQPISDEQFNELYQCVNSLSTSWYILQEMIQHAETDTGITLEGWITNIEAELEEQGFRVKTAGQSVSGAPLIYGNVKDIPLADPHGNTFVLNFQPQVTVQAPLKYAIPSYFGLFAARGDLANWQIKPTERQQFIASLPQYQKQAFRGKSKEEKIKILTDPINGFFFLLATTLLPLARSRDESAYISDLDSYSKDKRQIDVKQKLLLMGRRPFSSMWQQVKNGNNLNEIFNTRVWANAYIEEQQFGKDLLKNVQYAEYYEDEEGNPQDLTKFLPYFKEDFKKEYEEEINNILARGVLSTVMIKNFIPYNEESQEGIKLSIAGDAIQEPSDIFTENYYFDKVKSSIEEPKNRLMFDPVNGIIKEENSSYDSLSPPWFLNLEDAMGHYKDDQKYGYDSKYGESITEIRGIRDVGEIFTQSTGIRAPSGEFLVYPFTEEGTLVGPFTLQILALFNFLREVDSPSRLNLIISTLEELNVQ